MSLARLPGTVYAGPMGTDDRLAPIIETAIEARIARDLAGPLVWPVWAPIRPSGSEACFGFARHGSFGSEGDVSAQLASRPVAGGEADPRAEKADVDPWMPGVPARAEGGRKGA